MSEKSKSYVRVNSMRPLRLEEKVLLLAMLAGKYSEPELRSVLEDCQVEEMLDGGMGSIRFVASQPQERHLGKVIRKASYVDSDGVPVLISVNLDQNGTLYEIDFWKVNFSPLLSYPSDAELELEP